MIDAFLTDPGEQLIWQGKPYPARYALRKAAYSFPVGIFFFGFSLFWIYGAYMARETRPLTNSGLPSGCLAYRS